MEEQLILSPGINWQDIEGEIVILDATGRRYFGLNDAGALLWRALADGSHPPALADLLARTFEIPRPVAQHDVDTFVMTLLDRGLLTPSA